MSSRIRHLLIASANVAEVQDLAGNAALSVPPRGVAALVPMDARGT
jgi:hypothetical protein